MREGGSYPVWARATGQEVHSGPMMAAIFSRGGQTAWASRLKWGDPPALASVADMESSVGIWAGFLALNFLDLPALSLLSLKFFVVSTVCGICRGGQSYLIVFSLTIFDSNPLRRCFLVDSHQTRTRRAIKRETGRGSARWMASSYFRTQFPIMIPAPWLPAVRGLISTIITLTRLER